MKTTINLERFDFNSRIFNQISDCPDTGFIRVLIYTGDNYQEKLKQWFLNAEIVFINPTNNKIVYTRPAKSKNQDWVISNDYQVTVLDFQGKPIENHQFNPSETINEENRPYLTQGAFDRFSEFRVGTNFSLSMRQLWNMSVISDDANGYFDDKENHKNLVDIQKELYESLA